MKLLKKFLTPVYLKEHQANATEIWAKESMVSIVKMFCAPYVFVIVLSLVGKLILVAFEKPCAFQLFDW